MVQTAAKKKRVYGTVGALLAIFIAATVTQSVIVDANFVAGTFAYVDLRSPQSASYIYQNRTLDISFDYGVPKNWTQVNSFSYTLDDSSNSALTILNKSENSPWYIYSVFKTLENLAEGNHTLIIHATLTNGTVRKISDTTFTVNTTFKPPTFTLLSPLNQTIYSVNEVSITYKTNSQVIWAYYTLDSENDWKPCGDAITLTELSEGSHKIKVAVQSEANQNTQYWSSQHTVFFTVDTTKNNFSPTAESLTTIIVASIIITIVTIVGLIVYSKKFRGKKQGLLVRQS